MSSGSHPAPRPSWRPAHFIWPQGGAKVVLLGGIGSRTGDAERSFYGLIRYLEDQGGYDRRRDVLEGTYAGQLVGGHWQPRSYGPLDTRRHLVDSAEAVAGVLDWYRDALPPTTRLHVIGYSLGGVVGLDGATMAVARDRAGWAGRLGAVVTVASPVRGCNAGPFIQWAWLATDDPEGLGVVGDELDRRWNDPAEQERVERRAAFLRAQGARVLTLADEDDAVVRPDEALLPAPGQTPRDLVIQTDRVRPGSFGHGSILDAPVTWGRILQAIGPQTGVASGEPAATNADRPSAPSEPERDPIAEEIAAIKARLRQEGRLPRA